MFYKLELRDHVRVPPLFFGEKLDSAIIKSARTKYEGLINQDIGIVIDVIGVKDVGEGTIIAGDGAAYYETTIEVLTLKPELQEVTFGRIKDITDFGAFLTMGPIDGMIHISQTMDDFVSFSKDKVLLGRDSKRSLRIGDLCSARIIAISYKDITNPKIGLTMRQPWLGKKEWSQKEEKKVKKNEA
ncbi:DNA-directed RNA polymerase [Candidatus Woesearchaeota archaeon]|nr:DNA-directed RNA polymerase [Candidatus Woesearchaeota archaeon]